MKRLFLKLENHTVGVDANGAVGPGYANEDVYIAIQAQLNVAPEGSENPDLKYHWFNWATASWKPMSTGDNTVSLGLLGQDPSKKYADYGKNLKGIADLGILKNGQIQLPVPFFGGRAYLSFRKPIYLHINDGPSPAEPADDNPTDPNYTTVFDKFEFAVGNDDVLFSNTTAVDFVGIPLVYTLTKGTKTQGPVGFDILPSCVNDPLAYVVEDIAGDSIFKKLINEFRVFAPKVAEPTFLPEFGRRTPLPPPEDQEPKPVIEGSYLDKYIAFCWKHYEDAANEITLQNFVNITMAENASVTSDDDGKSSLWTAKGFVKNNVLTLSLTALTDKNGKTLSFPSPNEFTIPLPSSYDTFRQGGVFTKDDKVHTQTYALEIDGDIKNQVSTALNRCVMHFPNKAPLVPENERIPEAWWADTKNYYLQNGLPDEVYLTNNYSKFLHQKSLDNLVYALAFDDKFSQNVNLTELVDETPTVMHVGMYFRKNTGSTLPSFEDETGQVSITPDPDFPDSQAILKFTPASGVTVTTATLAYRVVEESRPDQYAGSLLPQNGNTFEVKFAPGSFLNPFKFFVKYEGPSITGEALIPTNVNGDDNPLVYKS